MGERERLRKLIQELAYEKGEVILASGKKSDFYVDCRQVTLHSEGGYLVGSVILDMLTKGGEPVEAVGGLTMGADPMVTSVSVLSHIRGVPLHAFIVRKEAKKHGKGAWIEGTKNLREGMKVAILEDVVTTGGSTLKAVEKAEEFGLKVERIICLVDREEGGRENIEKAGYRLESVFTRKEITGEE
ncbi:MAG: orotate phosphoribosyltransferase [Deltaproteobacteria bacterium]|nr:MAG: orotate phosphoribosyltransferase [Deltaproteobacteria bacterium]